MLCTFFSYSQCITTFHVINNGSGNTSYPGFGNIGDNNYLPPDNNYKITGQIEAYFSSPLPPNVYPPAILSLVETSPDSVAFDYKFAVASISADRTYANYNFYALKKNLNLPNGDNITFTIVLQYLNQLPITCTNTGNPPSQELPIFFSSFDVIPATTSDVSLVWTTSFEQNNKGFNVQKNDAGDWKNIGFVFSKAINGNSGTNLTYNFTDKNIATGVTQYRIQQIDYDGKFSYSIIRSVNSKAGKAMLFPNPSTNGNVNVMLGDDATNTTVLVYNMGGRLVKQFKGIAGKNQVIENLAKGFYTIQIINYTTTKCSVQKLVVM